MPFVQFAQIGEPPLGREPTVIDVPGVGKIGLLLSTTRRELPVNVKLTDFHAIKYRGAMNSYEDFVSSIQFTDKKSGRVQAATARLNEPAANGGIYYFQSGWGGENVAPGKQFSILGVGNRPGLHVMTLGAILIVIGIGYSFYVKPVLLKAKKESLAVWMPGERRMARAREVDRERFFAEESGGGGFAGGVDDAGAIGQGHRSGDAGEGWGWGGGSGTAVGPRARWCRRRR